jgi:hypothetical protein
MRRSSQWVAGEEPDREQEELPRPRVHSSSTPSARTPRTEDDILRHVRAVTPEQAQREAIRIADLREQRDGEDAEVWADRRATEDAERWEPPEAWVEREEEEKRKPPKRRS